MSFIAPMLARAAGSAVGGEAVEAAAGRSASFTAGMQGLSAHDLPIVGPSKAPIDDVEGTAKRTQNPNSVLR
ncbi:hypothetical protein [Terracoccus sp. 273MFTsu3.1]|uniref:hypothetical protein n=1 Tax=Terracoccus sp. 273MFTsu3.1 TaxID=1172188 RepID=UPI0003766536|nr:hypothetical protein [Terracoccus sp. 273MFTsu3.1]